jgi:hypothetical protein
MKKPPVFSGGLLELLPLSLVPIALNSQVEVDA